MKIVWSCHRNRIDGFHIKNIQMDNGCNLSLPIKAKDVISLF